MSERSSVGRGFGCFVVLAALAGIAFAVWLFGGLTGT